MICAGSGQLLKKAVQAERRLTRQARIPVAGNGIGALFAFITSFDEVTMTVFIASPRTETLPVRLFLYIQDNIDPMVASISTCLIAMTVVAMIILDRAYGLDRLFVGAGKT